MKFRKFYPASGVPWSESRLVRMWGTILIAGLVCKVMSALITDASWRLTVYLGGSVVMAVGIVLALVAAISNLRLVVSGCATFAIISMCVGGAIWYFALSAPTLWITVPGVLLLCLGILETWNCAFDSGNPFLDPF